MKISIIGSGYVGLCTGIGFASLGHDVICIDVDAAKVEMINNSVPPFFEHGIADAMRQCKISATQDIEEINNTGITFICVGTPSDEKGSIDLSYVRQAAENIGRSLRNKDAYHLVVMKSTVVPGTTESIIPLIGKFGKKPGEFGVCMNPEFLQEGSELRVFLGPDRIKIGELDKKGGNAVDELYKPFNVPVIRTNIRTAEMIKYAANAFLASRISLINELGNICKKLGIDTYDVAKAIGHDKRIGPHFLEAGAGFGGSCFPKDVSALQRRAEEIGCETGMMKEMLETNARQRKVLVDLLKSRTSLKGKKIAVLGLAFKEDTDDIRESPAIDVIAMLKREGASVHAYDPKAAENMKRLYPEVAYSSIAKALQGADACLILTKWKELTLLADNDFAPMRNKIIIEAKKVLDPAKVKGFEGICW